MVLIKKFNILVRMQPILFDSVTTSYTQWSYEDLTRFVAFIDPRWNFSLTAQSPPLEAFGDVIDLLKRQEEEILSIPHGKQILRRIPAQPNNPLFYFQRERWLDAYNKIEFWKHLPGGKEHLNGELIEGNEEVLAAELGSWMIHRPEVLNLTTFTILKSHLTRIPSEIGICCKLELLAILNTSIQELPPQIGELVNLKQVLLRGNRLRRLCPEFCNLQNLEKLDIDHNQLEEIDSVAPLKNVVHFSASSNQIKRLPEGLAWGRIKTLFLYDNLISELPECFYDLSSVQLFCLGKNRLSKISDKISGLRSVSSFMIDQNQLRTLPSDWRCLSNLRSLSIRGNQIAEIPVSLAEMPSLTEVVLRNNLFSFRPSFLPAHIWTDIS